MSWHEIERDDNYEVELVTYRCGGCHKLAVTCGGGKPGPCGSCKATVTNKAPRRGARR